MTIRISPKLTLPDDVATQSIAILARRGAGKTYTASVIVEEVIAAKVPVVVLDPTGAWWGLRTSADGQRPGLPVVIFGGDHGDVPLEATAGKVIADVVIEHPGAYVVDLSAFDSKAAEIRFAGDFLERLYRGKKAETGPLLLVVDEADMFAPQRPGPEQTRTLGALEAIVRRGRIKGLGDLLITQRAAVLNKNVLTQTEVLVVMQTTGPQDRAAIDDWIAGNATRDQRDVVLDSLASLERGEAWVWSPSWMKLLQRVRIRERKTFDSSRTPEVGEAAVAPRAFAQVDLAKLGARIHATVEQAKANDPAELRRQIQALKRELEQRPSEKVVETVERIVEVPILTEADTKVLQHIGDTLETFRQFHADLIQAVVRKTIPPLTPATATPRAVTPPPSAPRPPAAREVQGDDGEVKLKAGARRMLSALAMLHPVMLTRGQMATLSDISPTSGTFTDYLSAIRKAGLITELEGRLGLSAEGQGIVASELGRGAPSSEQLLEMWGRKLKAGARRMLDALHEAYPAGLTRAELGERAEISPTSGTFTDYLSMLRRNGLLDEGQPGVIRAGEALFLGSDR